MAKMILGILAFSLTALLVVSGASAVQDQPDLSGDPTGGRDLFIYKGCIKCHGVWEVGKKIGPDLTHVGMGRSFSQMAGLFWNHAPRMAEAMTQTKTPRPTFKATDIRDLVTYLYYINYFNEPGDPALGLETFSDKGCMDCHSVRGVGGKTGPRLDAYREYALPMYMSQAMWNHGPKMAAEMIKQNVQIPTFEGNEMADLLAFIRGRAVSNMPTSRVGIPGNPSSGAKLFRLKGCSNCHSKEGENAAIGPDLENQERTLSVTEIAGAMWNHAPKMWVKMEELGIPRPTFAQDEMIDLIAYLYFLGYSDPPGNVSKGRRLFEDKGCSACHTFDPDESRLGPNLAASASTNSPFDLIAAMWNHASQMEQAMEKEGLSWPQFGADEMNDLMAYLRSVTRRPTSR
jgi:cytochrome c2